MPANAGNQQSIGNKKTKNIKNINKSVEDKLASLSTEVKNLNKMVNSKDNGKASGNQKGGRRSKKSKKRNMKEK